jgi:hypothetical protein
MAVTATILIVLGVRGDDRALDRGSGIGGGVTDSQAQQLVTTSGATTTTGTLSAPTTVAPPPTTSVAQALEAALDVRANNAGTSTYSDGSQYVDLGMMFANRSPKTISAFQVSFGVSTTDSLGRRYQRSLLMECTTPLAPGESRSYVFDEMDISDAAIKAFDECTRGGWESNPYIAEEDGLYEAIRGGAVPAITVERNRVTFSDGTSIGVAVEGTR